MDLPFKGRVDLGPWHLTVSIRLPGAAVTVTRHANKSGTKKYDLLIPPLGQRLLETDVFFDGRFQSMITIPSLSAGPRIAAYRTSPGMSRVGAPAQPPAARPPLQSVRGSFGGAPAVEPLLVAVEVSLPATWDPLESGKHPYCFDMVDLRAANGSGYRQANGDFLFEPLVGFYFT